MSKIGFPKVIKEPQEWGNIVLGLRAHITHICVLVKQPQKALKWVPENECPKNGKWPSDHPNAHRISRIPN